MDEKLTNLQGLFTLLIVFDNLKQIYKYNFVDVKRFNL